MHNRNVWSLRRRGNNLQQIAKIMGLTEDEVRSRMRVRRPGEGKPGNADPNEFLIQLEASAIRLKWSELERANRSAMGRYRVEYCDPVSVTPPRNSQN